MANNPYYEYKIKNGDTFSGIIYNMFGRTRNDTRYAKTASFLLALNPQINNPDRIRAGDMLRLGVIPVTPPRKPPTAPTPPAFITQPTQPGDMEGFRPLSWLAHNSDLLTIPGSVALGASANLLSPGNVNLINKISDLYAEYKTGEITKGQYDARRKKALDLLRKNIGPMDKLLFGQHTPHQVIRIARAGGIPATAHIRQHADRLKRLSSASKYGGIVLVGVGVTAACMEIASTVDSKEKNKILVETITSTTVGLIAGGVITLFLYSNPIGWGVAIGLAVGSVAVSYGSGVGVGMLYNTFGGEIDLVKATGAGRICQ
ncbi:hypothetical protein MNBD_GAMMA17-1409 [hydrothermal vent metagenome]|uniref:LysM domain-containing protein n=1 Tax=hydrothermal vent metagenome TaxID=652676 RepID=A0A3B0ZLH8_9ZZZZ